MSDLWPALIEQLSETLGVEYKSAAPWPKIKQKIMRAAIAMANTEDGGHIVVGVKPIRGGYLPTGLTAEHRKSYENVEGIQAEISRCAAPNLECAMSIEVDIAGNEFAVFRVAGLRSMPHIAIKTLDPEKDGIQASVVYIRTNQPSSEPCNQTHWESLMNRAGSKMATDLLARIRKVGCGLQLGASVSTSRNNDDELFRQEQEGN